MPKHAWIMLAFDEINNQPIILGYSTERYMITKSIARERANGKPYTLVDCAKDDWSNMIENWLIDFGWTVIESRDVVTQLAKEIYQTGKRLGYID